MSYQLKVDYLLVTSRSHCFTFHEVAMVDIVILLHSVHWGINSPQKYPPLFCQAPPPLLNQQTVQAPPLFRQFPLYIGFSWPPPKNRIFLNSPAERRGGEGAHFDFSTSYNFGFKDGQLIHVSARFLDHIFSEWTATTVEQNMITYFIFYQHCNTIHKWLCLQRPKAFNEKALILTNFCIFLEFCFPWKCLKFMGHVKCIGMKKEVIYFQLWTSQKS